MSDPSDKEPIEIHIFAPDENEIIVEFLTVICHYHRNKSILGLGHTVNFGISWWLGSSCDFGFLSLLYLDGPSLEWLVEGNIQIRFLWLVPITKDEVEFKKKYGLEALEAKFESIAFNYLDPYRKSVV